MSVLRIRTGRGVRHEAGDMNKTERAYSEYLEIRRRVGEILEWQFNVLKLRLARKTFYDTDFLVMTADGSIEVHEVKGFMEDDAAVKLKVAAEKFPFRFILIRKKGGGWEETSVP